MYTEQQSGAILDLSQFVVSGEVARKINQVSTASVTLRNPHRKFTSPNSPDGVAFHPMDPITIYLERIKDYPIRVFTGYLDTTPYYQLYPQTITLQASCTLKRLLYTFFDPSLPYVYAFFKQYGWTNMQNGTLFNLSAAKQTGKGDTLQDSSFGKILWAVLYDIGQWQDSNIYIENLPSDLPAKIAALSTSLKTAEDQAVSDFEGYLKAVIGYGAQGSGGGTSGGGGNSSTASGGTGGSGGGTVTSTQLNANQRTFGSALSSATGLDPNVIGAWLISEEPASASQAPNGANNWLNIGAVDSGAWGGGSDPVWKDAQGAGAFTAKWMSGTKLPGYGTAVSGIQAILKTAGQSPDAQIRAIQTSGWASSGYPALRSVYQTIKASSSTPTAARGTQPHHVQKQASSTTQAGHTAKPTNHGPGNTTVIDAMVSAATTINNKNIPYVWGGGHGNAGTPSIGIPGPGYDGHTKGFDCSGAVGAVLSAANIVTPGGPVPGSGDFGTYSKGVSGPGSGNPECTIFYHSGHVFMRLNGKMWGTGANGAGGPGWHDHSTSGFNVVHIPMATLQQTTTYTLAMGGGGSGGGQVTQPTSIHMPLPAKDYGPSRKASDIKIIVLHATESSPTSNARSDIQGVWNTLNTSSFTPPGKPTEFESVHLTLAADGTFGRFVDDLQVAHHVSLYNPQSLGIEQVGLTSQSSWPAAQTDAAAQQIAYWSQKYNIPVVHSTTSGVCTHNDLGARGGGHTDPGAGYPFQAVLTKAQTILSQSTTTGSGTGGSGGGSASNDVAAAAYTNAFVAQIEGPSLQDMVTATTLGALHMGLMHDQSLLPFVQQLAQASMRSFQSLPNGDFYAFYPDYFGEFGHHDPYWVIEDIEILNGEIQLTDDALATHVFVIGDTTWPLGSTSSTGVDLNMMRAGTIDIQNAFGDTGILSRSGSSPVMSADEAVQFIKRYGARPLVGQYPMIRSMEFEMFAAYEQFMLAWSNQFKTPFSFTFMPELYPGGKVGFPDHGLQMYISSVTHSWDYSEAGFTTTAELSAPSIFGTNTQELPPNMVEAMIEPIKKANTKSPNPTNPIAQTIKTVIDQTTQQIETAAQGIMNVIDNPNPTDQNPAQTQLNQIVQGL